MINQKVVGGGVAGVGRADVLEDQAEGEPMQQQISVFLEGDEIPANVASRFCAAGGDSKTKIRRRRRKNSHDKKIFFLFLFHTWREKKIRLWRILWKKIIVGLLATVAAIAGTGAAGAAATVAAIAATAAAAAVAVSLSLSLNDPGSIPESCESSGLRLVSEMAFLDVFSHWPD